MADKIPALVFGGLLVATGVLMLRAQRRAALSLPSEADQARERKFLQRRIRRRTQIAGLILLVGVMIPVGDSLIPWDGKTSATWAIYIMIVLALTLWMVLLAMADYTSTRTHVASELSQLHARREELKTLARHYQKLQDADQRQSPES